MSNYVYSATSNSFFPYSLQDVYEAAGTWPRDGIDVSDQIYEEFISQPPDGKVRGAGEDGNPEWVDVPKKTQAELYQDELKNLASVYNSDVSVLSDSYAKAALIDGVSEEAKKLAIYNEYQERKLKYQNDIAALKSKYGV